MKTRENKKSFLILTALALAVVLAEEARTQSLWSDQGPRANLIADNVAGRKGDILTIIISEAQKIEDKQEVKLEKETSLDSVLESFNIKPNAFSTLPDLKTTTTKDFEGKSDYDKEGRFEAKVSVTVIDVLPNGNLVIEGRRNIFMDDEEKTLKITGVVRALDITTDNTVQSEKVADARVSYDGEGELSRATERSWFDKLLDIIWPF
jgi:flagellar L-ring protein precursor FlgH